MSRLISTFSVMALVVCAAVGLGCEKKAEKPAEKPAEQPAVTADKPTPEQVAAYPLDVCVVTGEKLGDHGEPFDLLHEGRLVRLCCDSCLEDFKAEPAKFLAKIDAAAAAKTAPANP